MSRCTRPLSWRCRSAVANARPSSTHSTTERRMRVCSSLFSVLGRYVAADVRRLRLILVSEEVSLLTSAATKSAVAASSASSIT